MAKEDKEKSLPQDQTQNAGAKIDAIRDILFGQQMQDVDSQFQQLKQELAVTQSASDQKVQNMHEDLRGAIQALDDKLSQLIQEQRDHTEQEVARLDDSREAQKKELGRLLISLGEKLI